MVDTLRAPEQPVTTRPREQSRARYPDRTGFIERPGGLVAYEVYGSGDPPIVFVPPWQIVHSRIWKAQIPDFARRHRVVAWDNLGNGHSDRPLDPLVHTTRERTANLGAVMDAAEVPAAVLVGLSSASGPMVVLASEHPEHVLGLVFVFVFGPTIFILKRTSPRWPRASPPWPGTSRPSALAFRPSTPTSWASRP